jgi:hypothetical protein
MAKIQTPDFLKAPSTKIAENADKVVLRWNNYVIRSLKDMRENFIPEELLQAHLNNELYHWLIQHYYEAEATDVKNIKMEDQDCLLKLCEILGITYSAPVDSVKAKIMDEKRNKISTITTDETILNNADITAFDQEELSDFLNDNQTTIYLFDNIFSIPISKSGIHYIGVGNVTIENAYTVEQYAKVGIIIENISLPTDSCRDVKSGSVEILIESSHSPLALTINNVLQSNRLNPFYHLKVDVSNATKFYESRYECKAARDKIITETYQMAQKHFDLGSSKCVAKEAAAYYDSRINSTLFPLLDNLNTLCNLCGHKDVFPKLSDLVRHAGKNILNRLEEELIENYDFYALYNIEYFLNQASVDEHDYRISENEFIRFLEKVATNHIHYTISGLFNSVQEMESDLNKHASTFFHTAYAEYQKYIAEIVDLVETLGNDFPEIEEGESISDYISRMCIQKAL